MSFEFGGSCYDRPKQRMERRVETRIETYGSWKMQATVESKAVAMGDVRYYIVPPVLYQEGPTGLPRQPAMEDHVGGPFAMADAAFDCAFRDCRRDIDREIEARKHRKVE